MQEHINPTSILAVKKYQEIMKDLIHISYPNLTSKEIDIAMDKIVRKTIKDHECQIKNNYTKKETTMWLSEMTNYVLEKEPICCSSGVMFRKHGHGKNPLTKMIKMFMDNRGIHKDEMLSYPKGSEMYEHFNLLQLLDKIDCNAIYGTLGAPTAMFYNINVASSITFMGQSLISAATMFFEGFLANNVKFASLEEILMFIHNVMEERPNRQYKDHEFLDRNISPEKCFAKIVYTIGDFRKGRIAWLPDEEDLNIIYDLLCKLDQEDVNRIYYKNNLYEFMDNKSMEKAIVYILKQLETPYLNPNKPPKEIQNELEALTEILKEYVYYDHQFMDRVDRCDNMIKKVAAISDTDSAIVSLDAWYHFALGKTQGIDMKIKHIESEFGENNGMIEPFYRVNPEIVEDYDFVDDKIIMREQFIRPSIISAPEGLRYSIINVMAYIITDLANSYMLQFSKTTHSYSEGRKCMLYLKNEFLFKRVLLTSVKKNYASIQELQEGNIVPESKELDIKGLPIKKSTLNKTTQKALEKILYEDILKADNIDQIRVIKDLAILEQKIFQSLESGNKEYYKPASIKSAASYDDPLGIQGIKASLIWNAVRDQGVEAIDLTARNTIDILKVNITERNIDRIKDTYPETYQKFLTLMKNTEIFKPIKKKGRIVGYDNDITSIAIPLDATTPEWLKEFIDYKSIINDNLKVFPKESVNIRTLDCESANYTNIMTL